MTGIVTVWKFVFLFRAFCIYHYVSCCCKLIKKCWNVMGWL